MRLLQCTGDANQPGEESKKTRLWDVSLKNSVAFEGFSAFRNLIVENNNCRNMRLKLFWHGQVALPVIAYICEIQTPTLDININGDEITKKRTSKIFNVQKRQMYFTALIWVGFIPFSSQKLSEKCKL